MTDGQVILMLTIVFGGIFWGIWFIHALYTILRALWKDRHD